MHACSTLVNTTPTVYDILVKCNFLQVHWCTWLHSCCAFTCISVLPSCTLSGFYGEFTLTCVQMCSKLQDHLACTVTNRIHYFIFSYTPWLLGDVCFIEQYIVEAGSNSIDCNIKQCLQMVPIWMFYICFPFGQALTCPKVHSIAPRKSASRRPLLPELMSWSSKRSLWTSSK